jgi:transcriptional regulator with XRE-family HTH domain
MHKFSTDTTLTVSKHIGRLIRELRKQRRLTGEVLAKKADTSQSRISKIENGYSDSIDSELVERLLIILESPKTIRQQISTLLFRLSDNTDAQLIYPFADLVEEGNDLQKITSIFRCYCVCGISATLQTTKYRKDILKRLGFSEEQIAVELGKTIERQEALWDASKVFNVVMPEAALYTMPAADTRAQIAQMDRLERIIGSTNVHIGVIPTQAGMSVFGTGTFTFYDDAILYVFMGDRIVRLQDSDAIPQYLNAFEEFSSMASFDAEAIPLIRKAADYFAGRS